ncbi:MAG: 16S rRNA (cytosine(967)-C(5))-methyltransferase RsmB [Eubacteriales bacterium]|nr:16S rRNA (cytosine(967)-C(5))-methyltransferase RsmB [Eubacteriales bacterium]
MIKNKKHDYIIKDTSSSRDVVLFILLNTLEKHEMSHVVLRETLSKADNLSDEDRALVTRIVNGTLDRLITIDSILVKFLTKPLKMLKPQIREILRMSVYQILYMDRIPDRAVCNEAVNLTKLHGINGLSGFVNGVLRNICREKDSDLEKLMTFSEEHIRYSMPKWLYKRLEHEFGTKKTQEICQAFLHERKLTVRFNTSIKSEEEILKRLSEDGVKAVKFDMQKMLLSYGISLEERWLPVIYELENVYGITQLNAFEEGFIQPQDPAAAVPCALARPEGELKVIDVCAAPGGKSIQIADLLRGKGTVEARDISDYKIAMIDENIKRCGLLNLSSKKLDALIEDEESLYRADIVIADLPCSGLGIIGRKPDIKQNIEPYSIEELQLLQRDILRVVSRYVKPHGKLIYSTCTLTGEEDEQNVAWAEENLGFKTKEMVKIFPGVQNDGFFAAVLEKTYR